MSVTNFGKFHTPWQVGSHDVATRAVEDWLGHSRICGAQRLPVSKRSVERRDISISYDDRFKVDLWPSRIEQIL